MDTRHKQAFYRRNANATYASKKTCEDTLHFINNWENGN